MVCYYISYVMFVCIWHWWTVRNKRLKLTDAHARDQYLPLGEEEAGHVGDDDDDGGVGSTERSGLLSTAPDIRLLESQEDEEYENELGEAVYVELSNNMRVTRSRPDTGQAPPVTPQFIRPSLVGALEVKYLALGEILSLSYLLITHSSAPSSTPLKSPKTLEAGQYTCAGTPTTQFCVQFHCDIQHQAL